MIRRALLPTALYALCATWVAAYLRTLVDPAPSWRDPVIAIVVVAAAAWGVRLVRPRGLRVAAVVVGTLLGALLLVGGRTDAWPWREDLQGRDGYLGAGGYVEQVTAALRAVGTSWVRVVFPADAVGDPDAVVGVRLIALVLLVLCATGLIVFRVPLLAVFAAAGATTLASLFVVTGHLAAQGIGLCLLGVVVLAAGRSGGTRTRMAVASGAGLAIVAIAVAALPGASPSRAFDWQKWTIGDTPPVDVGFVWDQQLKGLHFGKEVVPVLEVDDPSVDYLRVGVLERFDGYRWQTTQRKVATASAAAVALPKDLIAPDIRRTRPPMRQVEIRNLATITRDLPLPTGAVGISGLGGAIRPVTIASGGSVVLGADLPPGSTYTVDVANRSLTPRLLNADVLGALTDPREAVLEGLASIPLTGRHVDQQGPGPWAADYGGATTSAAAADAGGASAGSAKVLSKPDPHDLTLDGAVYPPFGAPGRERLVQRVFDSQAAGDPGVMSTIDGWRDIYHQAHVLTAKADTPYQAASILERWFKTTFSYDETASYGGVSIFGPLPSFLLSKRRAAHCQYFAGSMAVLLRMLGIPARVAYGFSQGHLEDGRRIVTNRDAHAWVEVRFPYSGWVAFDPTPARRLASSDASTTTGLDSNDVFQPSGSMAGIRGNGSHSSTVQGPNRGTTASSAAALPMNGDAPSPWPRRLLFLLGALIALVALGLLVWLAKLVRAWRAGRTDDPRLGAAAAHAEVAGWLDDQGIETRGASIADLGARASTAFAVPTDRWVEAVVLARYGPPRTAQASLRTVRTETRELTRQLRGRTTRRERVSGALRPRRLLDRR